MYLIINEDNLSCNFKICLYIHLLVLFKANIIKMSLLFIFNIQFIMRSFPILKKRRTSHADVPGDAKSGDGVSVKSDEYLRGSHEELIPGKSGSTNDPKWTYRDEKIIEKSTFASANEAKALDVLNTIIDINIDNEECITAQPPVCENVREGKWRPLHVRHKNESNVAVVINKAKETEPDKAPCRTLSDYDNFQIYVPEPEPSDPD